MADIFISSSRLDHERVKPIADRLSSLGYSVWWERTAHATLASVEDAAKRLEDAKAVLTIWSANAVNSSLVCAESACAFDAHKLVQLRIDNVSAPAPFAASPIADMRGTGEWGVLEDTLARLVRDGGEAPDQTPTGALPAPTIGGVPGIITFAIIAALVAHAAALSATLNGAMTSTQLQIAASGVAIAALLCAAISGFRLLAVRRAGG